MLTGKGGLTGGEDRVGGGEETLVSEWLSPFFPRREKKLGNMSEWGAAV